MPHIEIIKILKIIGSSVSSFYLFSYRTETDFEYSPFVQEYLENLGIEYRYDFCLTRIFFAFIFSVQLIINLSTFIMYWLAFVDHFYLSLSESKTCVFVLFICIWYVNFSFCSFLQIQCLLRHLQM
jgi:hypothetical protein